MKKLIIIAAIIVLAIVIALGVYFFFGGASNGSAGNSGTAAGGGQDQTVPLQQAIPDAPTSSYMNIGTPKGVVKINNFYLSSSLVTDGGETVILASTTEYLITYDTTDSSFWIGIDPGQFDAVRPAAEQAFLSVLGVNSTDACKLDVSVGTFWAATSSMNGQSFPLSFCGGLNSAQ